MPSVLVLVPAQAGRVAPLRTLAALLRGGGRFGSWIVSLTPSISEIIGQNVKSRVHKQAAPINSIVYQISCSGIVALKGEWGE